jgi:predicted N-acetyltransferase YhbS
MLSVGDGFGAEIDGELVGTVIVNRYGARLATIAMMLVAQAHQRRGVGSRLMEGALALTEDGSVYLYATDMGQPLYARFGFVLHGDSHRLEGKAATSVPPCTGLRPLRKEDLPALGRLDAEAQGAERKPLIEALCARAGHGLVIERAGKVVGFGLASSHRLDGVRVLAPVVAREDDDARALAAHLAAGASEPVRLDLEPEESALLGWGRDAGLKTVGRSPRMLRGHPLPGRRAWNHAIAGRAFG